MSIESFDPGRADTVAVKDIFEYLASSEAGLQQNEAASRIAQYGYNELVEKRQSALLKFIVATFMVVCGFLMTLTCSRRIL